MVATKEEARVVAEVAMVAEVALVVAGEVELELWAV